MKLFFTQPLDAENRDIPKLILRLLYCRSVANDIHTEQRI